MALFYGAEHGASERLISGGGNIYTSDSTDIKLGNSTRGRGHWTGKKYEDDEEPKVDDADGSQVNRLIAPDPHSEEEDGFDDDGNPFEAFFLHRREIKERSKNIARTARAFAAAVIGPVKKALPHLGEVKVDLLLADPASMDTEQLVKAAGLVKGLVNDPHLSRIEVLALVAHADRIHTALQDVVSKAAKDNDVKEHKPSKAGKKIGDAKGKTQYSYQKKGNGKGSQSDVGGKKTPAQGAGETPAPQAEEIAPPAGIDPAHFAKKLGLAVPQLKNFASKKTKADFVKWFTSREKIMQQTEATPAFLSKLYDTLLAPEPSPEEPQPQATMQGEGAEEGMMDQVKGQVPMGKGLIVFNSAMINGQDVGTIDLLKSSNVRTIEDMRRCMKSQHGCSDLDSVKITRTLLNRWGRRDLITIYSEK